MVYAITSHQEYPMKKRFPLLIAILCIGCLIYLKYRHTNVSILPMENSPLPKQRVTYAPAISRETSALLSNPYRGFYHIYGYLLEDYAKYSCREDVVLHRNDPDRLVLLQINLSLFRDIPLTRTALDQLDLILSAYAEDNRHIILRFLYDWEGNAPATEPRDLDVILTHIAQTASVYNQYKDRIFLLQGLYIGSYGEMHGSYHDSPKALQTLADALAKAADPQIYLSVRTPMQWETITGGSLKDSPCLPEDSPFAGRLGLYNDGLLSSSSDLGTFPDNAREAMLSFQNRLCRRVPNGGEIAVLNPRNDLEPAARDLARIHVSYLNRAYHEEVLKKWENTTLQTNDCYNGMNGLDYLERHLGYRYLLGRTALSYSDSDGVIFLAMELSNRGFSICYRPLDFTLNLLNERENVICSLPAPITSKELQGQSTKAFRLQVDISDLTPGTYRLLLQTTDRISGEVIRYANDLPLEPQGYLLGTLQIYRTRRTVPRTR